jgi:succinyl-CoA synthetase beta subunit
MKIHEYQAKELFRAHDILVPDSEVARDPDHARHIAETLGSPVVIKAQVHAGGRGKGGGVQVVDSAAAAEQAARNILGMELVTEQTAGMGKTVNQVLVERAVAIDRELYCSLLVNRDTATITILVSSDGGMNIEEVAAATPERIVSVDVNPLLGLQGFQLRALAAVLALSGDTGKKFSAMMRRLYRFFVDYDCSMVEINPLVVTDQGELIAIDAKVDIDGNSLYRHPDVAAMRDPLEEDPHERKAAEFDLNYIKLSGNIGNMVNGAGLAMATMDIIKQAGAEPANFLDVGGGASAARVEQGFRIILDDPHVKGILINIFGGILRCDELARGVVQAATAVGLSVPVVVRMEGTNVEEGRRILADSGLNLINAEDIGDAARKVAEIA